MAPITSEELLQQAANLEVEKGEGSIYVQSLKRAAEEIENLKFITKALTGLAERSALDFERQKALATQMQEEGTRQHNRIIELSAEVDRLKRSAGEA